ncbi:transcriptional regulator [Streptomyces anthocyanicus]|uniref:FMN-binding negative transcriptional regulator n=1 Tax=Streptomyces anthocyanicus TaxID=68174 RepID=UPI00166F70CB|nr:FMN-binding negative transcriptional regulator [Streptomyces anthocyanicus]GGL84936.1 transcriptional regulator [Streptomyces anthocyanicus]
MFIQPWDAALGDAEWQTWIADGHDFGILSVNGLLGHAPIVVPTHFTVDGTTLLVHLARPNPVWDTIEVDPNVTFTVTGDYDSVPTSYYAAVQFTCQATIVDEPEPELLRRQMTHFQPDGVHAPIDPDEAPYGRMPPGIRGLRMDVIEVRAKFKYDDHKPVDRHAETARQLTGSSQGLDASAAAQRRRRLDRTSTWNA